MRAAAALLTVLLSACAVPTSPSPLPSPTATSASQPPTVTPQPPAYVTVGQGGALRTPEGVLREGVFTRVALAPDGRHVAALAERGELVIVNTVSAAATRHDLDGEVTRAPLWLLDSSAVVVQTAIREGGSMARVDLVRVAVGGAPEVALQFAASPGGDIPLLTHILSPEAAILRTPDGSARLLDLSTGASVPLPAVPLAFAEGRVAVVERYTAQAPTPVTLAPFGPAAGIGEGRVITPNDFFFTVREAHFAPGGASLALIVSRPGDEGREVLILRDFEGDPSTIVELDPPAADSGDPQEVAWVPGALLVRWGEGGIWRHPTDGALPEFISTGRSIATPH